MRLFAQNEIAVITLRRAETFDAEQRAAYEARLDSDPLSVHMSVFFFVLLPLTAVMCFVNCAYRVMSKKKKQRQRRSESESRSSSDVPFSGSDAPLL